jgi:hypothetical protein
MAHHASGAVALLLGSVYALSPAFGAEQIPKPQLLLIDGHCGPSAGERLIIPSPRRCTAPRNPVVASADNTVQSAARGCYPGNRLGFARLS